MKTFLLCVLCVSAVILFSGCQMESIALPDGARFDRLAVGTKLEVAKLDVVKTADGFTAHVEGASSDASASWAAFCSAVGNVAGLMLKVWGVP